MSSLKLPPQDLISIPLLEWSSLDAWTISEHLSTQFITPTFLVDGIGLNKVTVFGDLSLAHDDIITAECAKCSFIITNRWRSQLPKVICYSQWLKRGDPDWHVDRHGVLCWEFDLMWKKTILSVERSEGNSNTLTLASTWLVHSVQWLLYRHYYATTTGITAWPESWPSWKHGIKAASEQYEAACSHKR